MIKANSVIKTVLLLVLLLFPAAAARAHEVPDQVTVLTFIKPESGRLSVLMRVPMSSLRDIDIPLTGEGFLDLSRVDLSLRHASQLWITDFIDFFENGVLLPKPTVEGARVSLPADRSFAGYDEARASILGPPLPAQTRLYWEQGLLDIAYEYPISSENSVFSVEPGLTRLGVEVNVLLRYLGPDGADRVFDVHPEIGVVTVNPAVWQVGALFAERGFRHVFTDLALVLFLVGMAIPVRRLQPLAVLGTTFAIGVSVALIGASQGLAPRTLWFPYLIEALVAVSVLYIALENIVGPNLHWRWWAALFFGLVHGFSLAIASTGGMQFAAGQALPAIVAFDLGLAAGGATVLVASAAVFALVFCVVAPRIGTIVVSAFIAHTAWDWTLERAGALSRFPLPSFGDLAASGALAWLTAAVALTGVLWLVSVLAPGLLARSEVASPVREP